MTEYSPSIRKAEPTNPNTVLGYDGSGNAEFTLKSSLGVDFTSIPTITTADLTDYVLIDDNGVQSKMTIQDFAVLLNSFGTGGPISAGETNLLAQEVTPYEAISGSFITTHTVTVLNSGTVRIKSFVDSISGSSVTSLFFRLQLNSVTIPGTSRSLSGTGSGSVQTTYIDDIAVSAGDTLTWQVRNNFPSLVQGGSLDGIEIRVNELVGPWNLVRLV